MTVRGSTLGLVRFVCHIPLFIYMIWGMHNYLFVKKHAGILLAPPLGRWVLLVESFAGPGAIVQFIWNFFTFIPAWTCEGIFFFMMGIVDTVFVVLLATRLHTERSFISLTYAKCNQVVMNGTTHPNLIFFERAWQTNTTSPDLGRSTCLSFLSNWYLGLAIIILYSISALTGLSSMDSTHEAGDLILCLWTPFRGVIWAISKMFGLLPDRFLTATSYSARYARKWTLQKFALHAIKLRDLSSRSPERPRGPKEPDIKLARILHNDRASKHDILQLIAQNLDYVDLVNLSLVSKRTRSAIFPADEEWEDDRQLRFYSCYGKKKSTCWICAVQICEDCSAPKNISASTVWYHMQLCQTNCTSCFRDSLAGKLLNLSACSCWDARRDTFPRHQYPLLHERKLCRECVSLSNEKLLALREKRDGAVYKHLAQQPLSCSICAVVLPRTGPRWWVCSKCSLECRSDCHPGWNRKLAV